MPESSKNLRFFVVFANDASEDTILYQEAEYIYIYKHSALLSYFLFSSSMRRIMLSS